MVELTDMEEIGENISKMLTIAETSSQLLIFLRALVSKVSLVDKHFIRSIVG